MFISTFELLLNVSQLPREIKGLPPEFVTKLEDFKRVSREILQGYFLTISNLEERKITLELVFTVVSSPNEDKFENTKKLETSIVTSFFDSTGDNEIKSFTSSPKTINTSSVMVSLEPKDTGLLIVQPNPFLLLKPLKDSEIEIRGYVEVNNFQDINKNYGTTRVLLTPEHRGTFYQLEIPKKPDNSIDLSKELKLAENQQLDQIAYSLPTGTGGALFEFTNKK